MWWVPPLPQQFPTSVAGLPHVIAPYGSVLMNPPFLGRIMSNLLFSKDVSYADDVLNSDRAIFDEVKTYESFVVFFE